MHPALKRLWQLSRTTGARALSAAAAVTPMRTQLDRFSAALDHALTPDVPAPDDFYGKTYFTGAKETGQAKLSGYSTYLRASTHADALAAVIDARFPGARTLDVGCARGFLVEALLEKGRDAWGCDGSLYAVNSAARGARGRIHHADLRQRLPFPDRHFDLVTAFETLEHVPPEQVPFAVGELARVARSVVAVTIPSFGPRPPLPSGWFDGKLKGERVAHYQALGAEYDGPVPLADLATDAAGLPLEGHVCIASFRWWRRQFETAGLTADPSTDEWAHQQLAPNRLNHYLDWQTFHRT